jgi:hypothetical protein
MKYILLILLVIISGCKSTSKIVNTDIEHTIEFDNTITVNKGNVDTSLKIDLSTVELHITRYEPVYFQINGKDMVELKPVIYKTVNTNSITEKIESNDTTSTIQTNTGTNTFKDKTNNSKSFTGFDIYKSIISGIFGKLFGGLFKYIWIYGLIFVFIIFTIIKNRLDKNKL